MNKKAYRKFEAYQRHVSNLKKLFPRLRKLDDADALSKLYRLEAKQSRLAVAYCNGELKMEEYLDRSEQVISQAIDLLGPRSKPIIEANGDPRGYALKLDEEWSRDKKIYRDFGGYGILCPEF